MQGILALSAVSAAIMFVLFFVVGGRLSDRSRTT
jgi:hypothetical protein